MPEKLGTSSSNGIRAIEFMYNDSLYRVSFKCLIQDNQGKVLVVKEMTRESWDLPGGGIDHGESIRDSIARELLEEVAYDGGFTYQILTVDEPVKLLTRDVWQMRIIIKINPEYMNFNVGKDADEITFINPQELKNSLHESERKIYEYSVFI